ncbi:MAG: hypothetical protein HC836_05605 [Richelia sp. RM2_1_2]|nr:hypothetical protein [Richelia sp. SM1_7_0]NJN07162.1 hypothetical protein [Richelia sp. RM1_1_1]NJO29100.1 hypothetical protein [Richelia sp. SL_2_1]NJO57853.1 hypothetical protein [Richelia sp. RM2_1_2]NJS16747.1 hypothetical protein [Nostocaceae cyanobacterium CSU_2_110]
MQVESVLNNNQQRPRCVIDPVLALSPSGLLLYKNLGKVMELWVVRELWYILDNLHLYLKRPELVFPRTNTLENNLFEKRACLEEKVWSLKEWEKVRGEKDLSRLNLFWLGDSLRESLIPRDREPEIFFYWETLARSLDAQINLLPSANDILTLAFRDAIALAVSLDSAFILTYQLPRDFANNNPPDICKALSSWGIPCKFLTKKDPIVALECQYLRQLIISAGLAKIFWTDIHIVVLHLVVASTSTETISKTNLVTNTNLSFKDEIQDLKTENYLWTNMQGFWYKLL